MDMVKMSNEEVILYLIRVRGYTPDQALDYFQEFPKQAKFLYVNWLRELKVENGTERD